MVRMTFTYVQSKTTNVLEGYVVVVIMTLDMFLINLWLGGGMGQTPVVIYQSITNCCDNPTKSGNFYAGSTPAPTNPLTTDDGGDDKHVATISSWISLEASRFYTISPNRNFGCHSISHNRGERDAMTLFIARTKDNIVC